MSPVLTVNEDLVLAHIYEPDMTSIEDVMEAKYQDQESALNLLGAVKVARNEPWRAELKEILDLIPEDGSKEELNKVLTEIYQRIEYVLDAF